MFYCIPFISRAPKCCLCIYVRVAEDYHSAPCLYPGISKLGGPKAAVENSEVLSSGLGGGHPALSPRFPWALNGLRGVCRPTTHPLRHWLPLSFLRSTSFLASPGLYAPRGNLYCLLGHPPLMTLHDGHGQVFCMPRGGNSAQLLLVQCMAHSHTGHRRADKTASQGPRFPPM